MTKEMILLKYNIPTRSGRLHQDGFISIELVQKLFDNLYFEFEPKEYRYVKYQGRGVRVLTEIKPIFVAFHRYGKYKKERLNKPILERYELGVENPQR